MFYKGQRAISALLLFTIVSHSATYTFVDYYDANRQLVKSKWYCKDGTRAPCGKVKK